MDYARLVILTNSLATAHGYRRRSGLYWKTGGELTRMIHLQRSPWGPAVYVNMAVTPSSRLKGRDRPSPYKGWGLVLRATTWSGPFRATFQRAERDYDDEMSPEQLIKPLRWLFAEVEQHLASLPFVVSVVLDGRTVESDAADLAFKTWARRHDARLKAAEVSRRRVAAG